MRRRWHDFGLSRSSQWERQYRYRMPAPRAAYTSPQSASSVTMLLFAGVLVCSQTTAISNAAPPLPAGTLPVPRANFVTSGNAAAAIAGNTMTVTQQSQRAILNWNSFNIAAGSAVRFNQPAATAVALNRIFDANPSVIQGQLSANGQIYLINRNGILFDKGSQINVNTLIASSLDISDQLFRDGLLSQSTFGPVFQQNPGDPAGPIVVEVGARIQTDAGGRVLLAAPSVINRGEIRTPDGQTVLAAGNKVFLRSSEDINLRGFLVEVDTGLIAPDPAKAAVNEGTIAAERGNISLVGLAVRQSGTLVATTSTGANGSIVLNARDTVEREAGNPDQRVVVARRAGTVHLTAGSQTRVSVDAGDTAAIDANVNFTPSSVDISGGQIVHEGAIAAPSGKATLTAVADPSTFRPSDAERRQLATPSDSRIFLAQGSSIDVAGTTDTVLPMSRNVLTVELRGDELKDFPNQRNGVLRGQRVVVDINQGTTIADVSRQIAAVPRGIGEVSATGGTVTMVSQGDIVMQQGASIDVSGGRVTYASGVLNTSKLVSQGRVYDIGTASPERDYEALLSAGSYSVQNRKWGVTQTFDVGRALEREVPGYVAGASAGSIDLTAHALALDGRLSGAATAGGPYQRDAARLPKGGLLAIGDFASVGNFRRLDAQTTLQTRHHDVIFQAESSAPTAPASAQAALPNDQPLALTTDFLTHGGFSRLHLERNGSVELPKGVDLKLPPGGSLSLNARALNVQSNIEAPAGTIALQTISVPLPNDLPVMPPEPPSALVVGPDATLSARGLWVNDRPAIAGGTSGTAPTLIDGGRITLSANADLRLGQVSASAVTPTVLDVTGGGWVNTAGTLRAGKGGDVAIGSRQGTRGTVQLGVAIKAAALGNGGALTLSGNEVNIRDGVASQTAKGPTLAAADIAQAGSGLTVPSWVFDTLGFTTYNVRAEQNLNVEPGTTLGLAAPYLAPVSDPRLQPTGSDVQQFTRLEALPQVRRAASLNLESVPGSRAGLALTIGAGAHISTDPGATLNLSASGRVLVNGALEAPAGNINLAIRGFGGGSYDDSQSIWLGKTSRLSAAGQVTLTPDNTGRRTGSVLDGGTVTIAANRGYVVSEAGSSIDVSGMQTELDVATAGGARSRVPVASNAGSIRINAAEGMLLDGDVLGKPGAPGASGGSLGLWLTTRNRADGGETAGNGYLFGNRTIALRAGSEPVVPAGLVPGAPVRIAVTDDLNGLALFNTSKLSGSGVTQFAAQSDQNIRFAGNVNLETGRGVTLDAPHIDAANNTVSLRSPRVTLGSSDPLFQAAPAPQPGSGTLTINANEIDLVGHTAVSGVGAATLASSGDLRVRGVVDEGATNRIRGAFSTAGSLNLNAAQIYPSTFSEFAINSGGDLTIGAGVSLGATPLSAGGALRLNAPNITVDGSLRAPLGSIELTASDTLTLSPGSRVSVSADGATIPFGATQNALDWVYSPADGANLVIDHPPEKVVKLSASHVRLLPGSTVDLSGGGDLFAYEFVPGPGGSKDALANIVDGRPNPTFAVLPSLSSALAPFDHQYYAGSPIKPGDSVYLAGGGGLAAGTYAMLPPRYALLPGALLVTPSGNATPIVPGQNTVRLDGTSLVAGFRASAGTTSDNRWVAYAVQPGSAARTLSEYRESNASGFFASKAQAAAVALPALPGDAGRLSINATRDIALAAAQLLANKRPGGRGVAVDISAERLAITSPDAPDTRGLDGFVRVNAADLTGLGAESLLIGGTRMAFDDATDVQVGAQQVVIANSAANPLRLPEVILAAKDAVTVRAGSVIEGAGARAPEKLNIGYKYDPAQPVSAPAEIARRDINGDRVIDGTDNIDGRGALLRVSGGGQVELVRNNVTDRDQGTLTVQSGAQVSAEGSLILDATRDTVVGADARIGAGELSPASQAGGPLSNAAVRRGGSVVIAAGLISAGDTTRANGGQGVDRGLILSDGLLDQLRGVSNLSLRSYGSIDFYGAAQIGGTDAVSGKPLLSNLELGGAGISGFDNAGVSSRITAGTVRLSNIDGAQRSGTPNGTGNLDIAAERIILGVGDKQIEGFANVNLAASTEIRGDGDGNTRIGSALNLSAPRITASDASRQSVSAERPNGTGGVEYFPLRVVRPTTAPAALEPASAAAAQLAMSGASVTHQGLIDVPGGTAILSAKGVNGDVVLGGDARIQALGISRDIVGVAAPVPAGAVALSSEQGHVVVDAGARIDVSSTRGDAGRISIRAGRGVAAVRGELAGTAPVAARSGQFELDAKFANGDTAAGANDFSALNNRLNAGGFHQARSVRLRSGDITVDAGDNLTAQSVQLIADGGKIAVNGTIDASGASGGTIALTARDAVTLSASGVLHARATVEGGSGGKVSASSQTGAVEFTAGSRTDVSKFAYRPGDINVLTAGHGVAPGTTSAYTATLAAAPAEYTPGMTVVFRATESSRGSSTLAINDLPAITIRRNDGTNTAAGDIRNGEIVKLTFDGTYFRLPPGEKGDVHFRAPRNDAGNDMRLTALGAITGANEVVAEGFKVYNANQISSAADSATNLSTGTAGRANTEGANFVLDSNFNTRGVRRRLSASAAEVFHLRPGVEVRSAGDLSISGTPWSLLTWRYNGEPGVLTLRAPGNINVGASVSDGFSTATTAGQLRETLSWSYRFTAGADLSSAHHAARLPASGVVALAADKGNLTVTAGTLLRTGSGDIELSAARDFVLGKANTGANLPTAAIYTAGRPSEAFPTSGPNGFPTLNLTTANYPTGGGDVTIRAQQDIAGAISPQLFSEWLVRRGQTAAATGTIVANRNSGWGVNFANFRQNVGALGGGDVHVEAAGTIDNLSVVLPTSGRLLGAAGSQPNPNNLVVVGGGNLSVSAGGDIRSGVYYVGRGEGTIRAGGSIVAGRTVADTNPNAPPDIAVRPVSGVLALGEGRFDVQAGGGIAIETALNPTAVAQDRSVVLPQNRTYFYTYAPDAGVKLHAINGDVKLSNDRDALKFSAAGINFASNLTNSEDDRALITYPGQLEVVAGRGNIQIGKSLTLFPSSQGNLQLFATGDIRFDSGGGEGVINLSDADPALILNPLRVAASGGGVVYEDTAIRLNATRAPRFTHALSPVHESNDGPPARIFANSGNISGGSLFLSKPAQLHAGGDIRDVEFAGQNLRNTDVTSLSAGRDVVFGTPRDARTGAQQDNTSGIRLSGPGRLEIEAGRNIDLGNSRGVVTRGNIENPALPAGGADITLGAGISTAPAYKAFVKRYFSGGQLLAVAQYVRSQTGDTGLSDEAAISAFDALPRPLQLAAPFMTDLRRRFYDELTLAGREATQPGGNYQRGFSAIETLFPNTLYRGDLSLLFSQIKTESGGSIDVLVPGGRVNAGQTTPPAQSGSTKSADQLGVLVFEDGAIHAFSKGDFAVNESRVFTLRGGDILIWSSEGDIDAGRGAKTAVSAPAPILVTDPLTGVTSFKFQSVSGSGIRSILTRSDIEPGSVDLIAPRGTVNAGDAGIGAAGNINIAALRVVGADNIQVGGRSTGVPLGDTGSAGRGLAGLGNVASEATRSVEQATRSIGAANQADAVRPGYISVEVLGVGP